MAQKYNIQIDQGATFSHDFVLKDATNTVIDLSNYTCRGQIRREYADTNAIVNFSANIETPTNGTINISLTAAQTAVISECHRYVYDVELISTVNDSVTRVVQGNVTIYPEATKNADGPGGAEIVV